MHRQEPAPAKAGGKARTPYEFGCKVSVATPVTSPKGGQFVLHVKALHGNPFDGHTLGPIVADMEKLIGVAAQRIHVDKGYRGHNHPNGFKVWITGRVRNTTAAIKREMKRRAAVEPVIGHIKAEHRMVAIISKRRKATALTPAARLAPAALARLQILPLSHRRAIYRERMLRSTRKAQTSSRAGFLLYLERVFVGAIDEPPDSPVDGSLDWNGQFTIRCRERRQDDRLAVGSIHLRMERKDRQRRLYLNRKSARLLCPH